MKLTDILNEMDVPGYDSWKTHNPAWDESDPEFDNDMVDLVDIYKKNGSVNPKDLEGMMEAAFQEGVMVDVDSSYDDLFGSYKANPKKGEKVAQRLEDYFGDSMDMILVDANVMRQIVDMDSVKERFAAVKKEGFSLPLLKADADDLKRFMEVIADNLEKFDVERDTSDDFDPPDDRDYDY